MRRCKKFRLAPGTMMIHLRSTACPTGRPARSWQQLRLRPSRASLDRWRAPTAGRGRPAAGRAGAGGRAADRGRSSRAPAGKHVLWVQVRVLPAEILGDAAGEIAPRHWDASKEAYADRQRHHRALRAVGASSSRAMSVSLRSRAENLNLVGGDQISAAIISRRTSLPPSPRGLALNTPMKNIYIIERCDLAGSRHRRRIGSCSRNNWRRRRSDREGCARGPPEHLYSETVRCCEAAVATSGALVFGSGRRLEQGWRAA